MTWNDKYKREEQNIKYKYKNKKEWNAVWAHSHPQPRNG